MKFKFLIETDKAVQIRVLVSPGSKREAVIGIHDDCLKLSVRAPAVDGKANKAVVSLIASSLAVSNRTIEIIKGVGSRRKTLAVSKLSLDRIEARLDEILKDA